MSFLVAVWSVGALPGIQDRLVSDFRGLTFSTLPVEGVIVDPTNCFYLMGSGRHVEDLIL